MDTLDNVEKPISSTERTAWAIAARHLAQGQRDPVKMIVEAINEDRARCVELLQSAGVGGATIPLYISNPDFEW